ncbi:MAG: glycerophosphodiester phosphodiesterase [Gemmatimonadaceae bacterium]|nr:glycerophosphodiester phosphodiesterase [Gemmatimonadaceae bacterium]
MPPHSPLRIAHRGAHSIYPENSLEAILAALGQGADAIEIDVHLTNDGVLVVHHDPELCDGRQIAGLSSKDFVGVELTSGIRIPMLDEVLEAVADKAILFIETKVGGTEFPLMRAVRSSDAESAVHSFHHETIRNLKRTMPALRAGVLTSGPAADAIAAARATRADDIWHSEADIGAELVNAAHGLGQNVIAWTVNSRERCTDLTALGVDGICTDDLPLLSAVTR